MAIKKMKKRKPRKAIHRRTNNALSHWGIMCDLWDGGYPECSLPWANSGDKGCNGNPFVCKKLYYQYLARSIKPDLDIIESFETRNNNSQKPIFPIF